MRYAFMSFSCPRATLAEALDIVKENGYTGFEPRIAVGHAHGIELGMTSAARREARDTAAEKQVDLCCLATSVQLSGKQSLSANLDEARRAIEKLVGRINGLNRELTKLIAWCDEISDSVTKTYAKASRAKRDYDAVRTVCDAEKDSFMPKIEALTKDLEEKKAKIPPELMQRYQNLKKNYLTPVAKVINGQCGGCYMMLSSVQEKRVASGNAIIQCENCGRLLFM